MNRKTVSALLCALGVFSLAAQEAPKRQVYAVAPEKAGIIAEKVTADLAKDPAWQAVPFIHYTVNPMSAVRHLPDRYPEDGIPMAPVGIIAAQGEYEPGSFVIYPRKSADKFEFRLSDLKTADGSVFPASQLDLKVVKVWYQAGSAWYGYFADALTHALCPELLLNDETLVMVDPLTKDNYVRYRNADGSTRYQWMTAPYTVLNYEESLGQANTHLIADADTLQPVVLNPGEFKQFMLTANVLPGTKPGLYTGAVQMIADGKAAGSVPVRLRVLPFELPVAGTYYNPDREYQVIFYSTDSRLPKVMQNLVRHNTPRTKGFPHANPFFPERFRSDIALAKTNGLKLDDIYEGIPSCNVTLRRKPTAKDLADFNSFRLRMKAAAQLAKKELPAARFYSYGVDEGMFDIIRKERAAWDIVHESGAKVMVSTSPHQNNLYGLDYAAFAVPPVQPIVAEVDKYHQMNPDARVGWYANPHSAPENPDFIRRMHGFVAYKYNFDNSSNYSWWRNNWNDHSVIDEHGMRALIMVYGTRDNVIDTLEWESVREGIDDVRYLTLLHQLAKKALNSPDWSAQRLARTAMAFIAYADPERDDIDPIRMEAISFILKLQSALAKGGK